MPVNCFVLCSYPIAFGIPIYETVASGCRTDAGVRAEFARYQACPDDKVILLLYRYNFIFCSRSGKILSIWPGGTMVERAEGERRSGRMVRATDAEWARVREAAGAAGLSISAYVVRTLLARPEPTGCGLPPTLVRRLARAVLVLERGEQLRFEEQGGDDRWRALVEEIEGRIDLDAPPE